MRRDTMDSGSQPVRNRALNPRWESVGASTIARTNLALYPTFDYAGVFIPVRQNLCTNPRGVLTMLHYSGAGAQTITNNIAVTAPEGITTAIRFTYGPSASNPGLNIMSPVSASTTYTMSAYVMIESLTSTPGGGGFAENGVVSGTALDNTQIGVWQKITWTRTTTASPGPNFGIRFAAVGGTGTGSILVTGILIEAVDAANASPTFFDGATAANGDFTYAWTSTANASVSWMRAPSIGGWAATSTGIAYQSQTSPMHGTKCGAVLTKGFNGDGLYHSNINITAGLVYTVSIWIKLTSTVPSMNILMRWKDNNETILKDDFLNIHTSLVVGQWVRVSATFTAFTGATRLQPMVRVNATHTPTTFYVDSMLVEQGTFMSPYFDGTTAATSDLTYGWVGTAFQSASREMGTSPALANSTGSAVRATYVSTDRPGSSNKFVRLVTYSDNVSVAINPTDVQIKDGLARTDLLWIRSSRALTVSMRYRNPSGSVVVAAPAISLPANQWQLYRNFATPSGADDMALGPLVGTGIQAGDTIDIGPHMTVLGEYTGDYVDGTKPFSKWDGAADNSTSVGYPPQLLDLAGKPDVDVSAVGTYTLSGGWSNTEPRTAYTVYNNLLDIPDSSVPALLTYGATALNDVIPNQYLTLRQQSWTGDVNFLLARRTGGAGAGVSGAKVGVNVATWGVNATGTIYNCLNNGATAADGSFVIDMPHEKIQIQPATAYGSHVRTLIYRGLHTPTQRAAVSRYLGNKYGAPVA